MNIIYLGHSGFLVETATSFYIFDYVKGRLPEEIYETSKNIYVFASHVHPDHFTPDVFEWNKRFSNVKYILSHDITKKIDRIKRFKIRSEGCEIISAREDEKIRIGDITVETLKSTDIGVAFIVTEAEGVIYHAGDLNWWHWDEEDKAWNRNMEVNFKKEITKIADKEIDVAFMPLDPRQEEAYWLGMQYTLEQVRIKKVYPMHFWDKPEIIDKYILEHGNDKKKYETFIEREIFLS